MALTQFFVDTFTSGSLVALIGHVPDTGTGWVAARGPFSVVDASELKLFGTLRCTTGYSNAALAQDVPVTLDQRVSIYPNSFPVGNDIYLLARWVDTPTPHGYALRMVRANSSTLWPMTVWFQRYTPGGNNLDLLGAGGTDISMTGTGGQIDFELVGSLLKINAGGTVGILTHTDSTPITHVGQCGIAMGPSLAGNHYIDTFAAASDPDAVVPVADFWTNFMLTSEVD